MIAPAGNYQLPELPELPEISMRSDAEEEAAQMQQLEAEALEMMAASSGDPSSQSYFMRLDRKSVIENEKEYAYCIQHNVPCKIITYGHARQLLAEADAAKRNKLKAKKARKVARVSRKKNR